MIRGIKKLGNKNVTANSLWGIGKFKKKKKGKQNLIPQILTETIIIPSQTLYMVLYYKTVLSSRTLNIAKM